MSESKLDPAFLRQQIVGVDSTFETPFGERLMVYCDYTASGRCLRFVESYLQSLQRVYANTHTEDDITGRSMSQLLHEAEEAIKKSVNAGPSGRIIACGTGATGAIDKLQQIIGVALAPATRQNINRIVDESDTDGDSFRDAIEKGQPVVFVGPYEHHSNEISWRQSLAQTVEVRLDASGQVDLEHLEQLLQDPAYQNRLRVGSFSAASNVTRSKELSPPTSTKSAEATTSSTGSCARTPFSFKIPRNSVSSPVFRCWPSRAKMCRTAPARCTLGRT